MERNNRLPHNAKHCKISALLCSKVKGIHEYAYWLGVQAKHYDVIWNKWSRQRSLNANCLSYIQKLCCNCVSIMYLIGYALLLYRVWSTLQYGRYWYRYTVENDVICFIAKQFLINERADQTRIQTCFD